MKFDREKDAIEYTKDPDEYTFAPKILGDARAGKKMQTYSMKKLTDNAAKLLINDAMASTLKKQ